MNLYLIAAALVALGVLAAVGVRALGGNLAVLDHWKQAWRYYSTFGLLLIAELPNIWNAVMASGALSMDAVPGEFVWATRIMAAVTAALLYIKQVDRPEAPDLRKTGRYGG